MLSLVLGSFPHSARIHNSTTLTPLNSLSMLNPCCLLETGKEISVNVVTCRDRDSCTEAFSVPFVTSTTSWQSSILRIVMNRIATKVPQVYSFVFPGEIL